MCREARCMACEQIRPCSVPRHTCVMAAGRPWMAVWLASTLYCSWGAGGAAAEDADVVASAAAVRLARGGRVCRKKAS